MEFDPACESRKNRGISALRRAVQEYLTEEEQKAIILMLVIFLIGLCAKLWHVLCRT